MIRIPNAWQFTGRAFDTGEEGRRCSATGVRSRWMYEVTSGNRKAKVTYEALRDKDFVVEVEGINLTGNRRSNYLQSQRRALEAEASLRRGVYYILRLKDTTGENGIRYGQLVEQLKLYRRLSPKQVAMLDNIAEREGLSVEPECWPIDLKRKGHLDDLTELLDKQPSMRKRLQRHQLKRIDGGESE